MTGTLTADDIAAGATELVPEITERAAEIASLRKLPTDLVERLRTRGMFRLAMPLAWGGPEMSVRAQAEVVETLSYADPSVGWCVMIGSDAGFYGAFLDEGPVRELFPDLDLVTAGLLQPAGQARRMDAAISCRAAGPSGVAVPTPT